MLNLLRYDLLFLTSLERNKCNVNCLVINELFSIKLLSSHWNINFF